MAEVAVVVGVVGLGMFMAVVGVVFAELIVEGAAVSVVLDG